MGMYNEVYKKCPNCASRCTIQISQISLGFGGFDLDDLDGLSTLSKASLEKLAHKVKSETFWCLRDKGGCGHFFTVGGETNEERRELAERLFR